MSIGQFILCACSMLENEFSYDHLIPLNDLFYSFSLGVVFFGAIFDRLYQ